MDIIPARPMLRADLRAQGVTGDEIDRARHAGRLTSVRPGAYLRSDDERLADPEARHALAARAAVRQHGAVDGAASHTSAAALHGLPLWRVPLVRSHLTRPGDSGGRRTTYLHLHRAELDADEIVLVDGVRVTSPARTVVDLARTLPFEQAVAIADAALHQKIVTTGELERAVARAGGARGLPAARRVVAFADGAADGPGESISRVRFARAGLPRPELQHVVLDAAGRFIAQVDFWWPGRAVVGEFDGKVKYERLLKPGQNASEVVYREKRREDAVRATGSPVIRWDWRDLDDFADVVTRLAALLTP
ncbi:hypothetical protein EV383_4518 [Pseudonocardia sediminis]|uniref:Uncharacterized protein n=1 Tax=Pseudonocardia sediminis TaxID=1397368 RepID=A0A4Q7UZL9_PSEST|nr:hypothetical protein [Pseudonocardia sediminis]RZT87592.1 hypothetical protein EV383_4518 [Pseudonocardia sediminis]